MSEHRQITWEQAQRLQQALIDEHGPPTVDSVAVDDNGAITTKETWGDEFSTTMRRTPLRGSEEN